MSPSSSAPGRVRSSDAVNEDIRALWIDPRVRLTPEQRARYLLLVAEYEEAKRAEVVEAA